MSNKPFPFESGMKFGHKPSLPQQQLNSEVAHFYDKWKEEFLQEAVSYPGCYYIKTGGGTNAKEDSITVSEGHGYGMLTIALMEGYDPEAKRYFDGMFRFFKEHPSSTAPALPSWQVLGKVGEYETADTFSSATDGDFDVAYALLLADNQWGSDGEINYRKEALAMIDAIAEFDVHDSNKRILLGDWVKYPDTDAKYKNATRPSDWMPAQLRSFGEFSKNDIWHETISVIYELAQQAAHDKTGLLPDFVVGDIPEPAAPHFLENFTDGSYGANACRVPWRIAMDYSHNGDENARSVVEKMMNWLNTETDGSILNMCNGYHLDGNPIWEDNIEPRGMYAGPFMVAATVSADFEQYLTSSWNYLVQFNPEAGYYSNSIAMLCLLVASGNWWKPE